MHVYACSASIEYRASNLQGTEDLVLPFSLKVFLCPFAGRLISLIDVGHNPRFNYKSRSPLSNGQRDRYRCLAFRRFR